MGKLKTIYLALVNRKDNIVKKEEIIKLIGDYHRTLKKVSIKDALWYLSRRNYIKRIFLDYYYINSIEEKERGFCNYEDRELLFEVLNRERIKWYMGSDSALNLLGENWQVPNVLTIINNKISGERKVVGMKVKFIKIKDNLIFGLKKNKTKNKVTYFYSDLQKTKLDFVYLREQNKVILDKKTREYMREYPRWLQKSI